MTFPAVDSLDTYGGAKVDLNPITDPTTDRPSAAVNEAYASVAAMTHTAVQCWARVTTAASTGAMVLSSHDAAWGNEVSVAPTLARTTTGVFTVTWPATVTDELGDTPTVALRAAARPNTEGATLYFAQAVKTSANVVTFYVFNSAGAANDAVGVTFWVGSY